MSENNSWTLQFAADATELEKTIARDFWIFNFDGQSAEFGHTTDSLSVRYGVSGHEIRKIQNRVAIMQAPNTVCSQCQCGLTWHPKNFGSRADFQDYVARWQESVCNDCRAERRAKDEARRAEQERLRQAEAAERKARLQQRYDDRAMGDCPRCDGLLIVRKSHKNGGMFIGCSEYPRCGYTTPIPKPVEMTAEDKAQIAEVQKLFADAPTCPDCAAPMRKIDGKYGAFLGCTNYPRCDRTMALPAIQPQQEPTEVFDEAAERARMQVALDKANRGPQA